LIESKDQLVDILKNHIEDKPLKQMDLMIEDKPLKQMDLMIEDKPMKCNWTDRQTELIKEVMSDYIPKKNDNIKNDIIKVRTSDIIEVKNIIDDNKNIIVPYIKRKVRKHNKAIDLTQYV
jgi:polyhydroxyalkanoate synthesis regulator protein